MIRKLWKIIQNNERLIRITSTIYYYVMLNRVRGKTKNNIINNGGYL